MTKIMGILNLTPDSFWAPSRCKADEAGVRIGKMLEAGADIIDIGAVSTRPGAPEVSLEEEWRRLRPVLPFLKGVVFSVDTVRAEIVRRVFEEAGSFIVNDISSGEDDPAMLPTVAGLKLGYVAMHKRGCPQTMDSLCDYPEGVVTEVMRYFRDFASTAERLGIRDWVLDPGFGFAKTEEQNIELLEHLRDFSVLGRPVLVGIADKRFTHGDTEKYHRIALLGGADILRVHDVAAARRLVGRD